MIFPLRRIVLLVASLVTSSLLAEDWQDGPAVLAPPSFQSVGSAADVMLTLPAVYPDNESSAVVEELLPDAYPRTTYPNTTEFSAEMIATPSENTAAELPLDDPDAIVEGLILEDPAWYAQPVRWIGTTPWDAGIELGINGSTGSTESHSIRTGGSVKRNSDFAKIDISAYYNKTSANGQQTQNNAKFDVRNDWLIDKDSPWTLFFTGSLFYDEFQAFDLQANSDGGVGFRIINTEPMDLTVRVGAGASREFGGSSEDWVPEALFGFDLDQQLTETQKLYAKLDYFPQLDGFSEFRLVTDVGWEIDLARPSNMSLKLAMTDRYDSTPEGSDPRLLNYSVLLLWKL
jgi:putative salt-induced outer membrane protein YdiY